MCSDWSDYDPTGLYDELFEGPGRSREAARAVVDYFQSLGRRELNARKRASEIAIREMGVSFTVYTEGGNIDRAWPFDIVPRIIPLTEWRRVEKGLAQRTRALNRFIQDIYNEREILKADIVPEDLISSSTNYQTECEGCSPAYGVWAHITGSDMVRDADGRLYVLEDNLRVPSGVSYMIENRGVTKRVLPELFQNQSILPVDEYPRQLFELLASLSPRDISLPEIVVLTPGIHNSAYFEHAFLAREMGAELVEGGDLFVAEDECVYMKTVDGAARVDVIYRRIDDTFMDPEAFRPDSSLGVPGLMRAWRKGNVAIANAPGSGVADDKAVYAYVPSMIRYYLGEEPILDNVPTYLCRDPEQRAYVLEHLEQLVVKPVNESGGYGIMVGPQSDDVQRQAVAAQIRANPRNFVAQPTLKLSTAPTVCEQGVAPRHLDLRPFTLQGARTFVTAGGLTRVALRAGSLVVNSSQGGGSKDTWIVDVVA